MCPIVAFPSDEGDILVEVSDEFARTSGGRVVTRGGDSGLVERSHRRFEDAVERVEPAVRALVDRLARMPVAPDEIELTFGIQLSAEFGAIVTNATSTANFAITMRWTRAAVPAAEPPPVA
jgi:Trypsin-co-occurring domain 1